VASLVVAVVEALEADTAVGMIAVAADTE